VSTFWAPVTVIPNVPWTLPLKFPLRVKLPVSVVWPDTKQEPVDVMVKFVILNPLPPVSVSVVVKEKTGGPPDVLIRLALQFPLMVVAFDPPPLPHPTIVSTSAKVTITQTGLCTIPPLSMLQQERTPNGG
jgi:hypothetical protein